VQYISNGPDIPAQLIHAHEEGRVVFFCGAGISVPAGLPNYSDLVSQLFDAFPTPKSSMQNKALKAKRYDSAIAILEKRLPSGRKIVRAKVAEILKPNLEMNNAKKTHRAMLELSSSRRDQKLRLVTTNFDRIFEEIICEENLQIESYAAPNLPVRDSNWNGIVYLHGLLPGDKDTQDKTLDQLVLSSSDFGLAYLAEGWVSRFLRELFRKHIVCFVGYSIDDPMLQYMVEAFSAEQQFEGKNPEMFAFASYSKNKEKQCDEEWEERYVTPIKYKMHNNHSYLHRSLHTWAESFRDGVQGKERVVAENAMKTPALLAGKKEIIDQLLWALSDPSGLPAKRFAELNPVPSLEWLEPLSSNHFQMKDIERFGISPAKHMDESINFSLIRRPCPHNHSPPMAIVDNGENNTQWDNVMRHLAKWLTRHLNDPNLLLWISRNGGRIHEEMAGLVRYRLDQLRELENKGHSAEIERIKSNAPNAIPNAEMRTLWELLMAGVII